jgi:hypothetical protein
MNLKDALAQIPDFRSARGQRYPLQLILLLVIMGTLSNCIGYKALEDFSRRHHQALVEQLDLAPMRFPSDSTFRRIMMGIDFSLLAKVFHRWATSVIPNQPQQWLAVDGKTLKATVSNHDNSYQDFISVVSVFQTHPGIARAVDSFHNKENSEIAVVQALLATLQLESVVFTFDSLHCQKKLLS